MYAIKEKSCFGRGTDFNHSGKSDDLVHILLHFSRTESESGKTLHLVRGGVLGHFCPNNQLYS